MTSPYDWWMTALEMAGDYGKLTREQQMALGIHENDPQCGFFRAPPTKRRMEGGVDAFIAIWPADDGLHALWDGEPIAPEAAWTWCAPYPIEEERYRSAERQGFRPSFALFAATVT